MFTDEQTLLHSMSVIPINNTSKAQKSSHQSGRRQKGIGKRRKRKKWKMLLRLLVSDWAQERKRMTENWKLKDREKEDSGHE